MLRMQCHCVSGASLLAVCVLLTPGYCDDGPLFPVKKLFAFGYINRSGEIVIAPQFSWAGEFREGLAPAQEMPDDESHSAETPPMGFIDRNGTFVIAPRFSSAEPFSDGLALVIPEGEKSRSMLKRMGFIDRKGNFVIGPELDVAYPFDRGVALVGEATLRGRLGLLEYVPYGYRWHYVDATGQPLSRRRPAPKQPGEPQLYPVWRRGYVGRAASLGYYEYVNQFGETAIKKQFDDADQYHGRLARVCVNGKWGYIDEEGAFAIPPQYDMAGNFSQSMAWVAMTVSGNRRFGYVNVTGELVIPADFRHASDFSEGLAAVLGGDDDRPYRYRYIDKSGSVAFAVDAKYTYPFRDGLAKIEIDDRTGYVDRLGHFVWPLSR